MLLKEGNTKKKEAQNLKQIDTTTAFFAIRPSDIKVLSALKGHLHDKSQVAKSILFDLSPSQERRGTASNWSKDEWEEHLAWGLVQGKLGWARLYAGGF